MRILIIADEVWNDDEFGNNVLSNWFNGFNAQFAEIYCSPGKPKNQCCERYFQLTDLMMVKSIFGQKAGRRFLISIKDMKNDFANCIAEDIPRRFYAFMKSISTHSIRLIRDLIWLIGRYDKLAMKEFIDEFNPDIVFCPRLLTPKLLRLERTVSKMTDAPFIAFTADDEASLIQVSYSPIYWMRRLLFRKAFKKHVKLYRHYFTFSDDQAKQYAKEYGIPTSTLYKSGDFEKSYLEKSVNNPIRLVYAGRLYCNRWKTLAYISKALKGINSKGVKMTLDIYSQETLTKKQLEEISPNDYVKINGRVSSAELVDIYEKADIALHVESFDKRYRYATRVSFSTKIIDLMASSCAIMAIAWEHHAGYQYLKSNDAAFCIPEYEAILPTLQHICENPQLIKEYANKAWRCGRENHNKHKIQSQIFTVFESFIRDKTHI